MSGILIVDDDRERSLELKTLAIDRSRNGGQVVVAATTDAARLELIKAEFDLLILDVVVPRKSGEEPDFNEGLALLEEIQRREIYKVPSYIVGITAHEELAEDASTAFTQGLWSLVFCDRASDDWKERVGNLIEHASLRSRTPTKSVSGTIDACVLTALPTPELSQLKAVFGKENWEAHTFDDDAQHYWQCIYGGANEKLGKEIKIVACHSPQMGLSAAAATAVKMIHRFRPKLVAMVGIAAGIKGRVKIGEVVAADPVWDWGAGKIAVQGDRQLFLPSPYQYGLDPIIRNHLLEISNGNLNELRGAWDGQIPGGEVKLHIGPLASGASVIAATGFVESIVEQHRKLLGIEMEAYAVHLAARESVHPQPFSVVLKGICDYADEKKEDASQEYAAFLSSQMLKLLLDRVFF